MESSLQIDVETFRNLALEELNGREYLAGWLEGEWLQKAIESSTDGLPITPKGREFVDFYETLYHVLH